MSADRNDRIRLRVPPRTGPVRSAAAFVRPPYNPEPPTRPTPPYVTPPHVGGAPGAPGNAGSVERAVQNAYRVLDEQLRRGEEAARNYRGLFERGELSAEDLPGLPKSAIRLWSEMLGLWLDVLGPLAPAGLRSALRNYGGEPPWPERDDAGHAGHAGRAGQAAPGFEPMRAQPLPPQPWTRVTLDISTTKPIELHIDLSPDAELGELLVQDLVAFEGGAGKPPITGVKLEPGRDGRLVLRLFVPPDQPDGTYLGMILDRAQAEQRGTLRLLVRT